MSMSAEAESPFGLGLRFQRARGLVVHLMVLQLVR